DFGERGSGLVATTWQLQRCRSQSLFVALQPGIPSQLRWCLERRGRSFASIDRRSFADGTRRIEVIDQKLELDIQMMGRVAAHQTAQLLKALAIRQELFIVRLA